MVVAAWNEEDTIAEKIENTLSLDYPSDKLDFIVITDGSTDKTPQIVYQFADVKLMHQDERNGKTAALNRAMEHVKSEIVIFSDANAMLNKDSIQEIVKHYENPEVGCVAGEKEL